MDSGGGKSDARLSSVEEEAMKRNTDCVYFLASPLTCKKGIECEYRHSEGARINPRDCRFWLSGNCLNPRCIFRHPPLDGLFGNPGVTSVPVVTSSQMTPSVQVLMGNPSANSLSRSNVPCYYFQKGACLKGDKCPFMHGPRPAGNPVTKQTSKVGAPPTSQLETPKKDALAIRECSNQEIPYPSPSIGTPGASARTNEAPSFAKDDTSIEDSVNYLPHKSCSRNLLSKSQPKSFPQPHNPQVQPSQHYLHGEAGIILEEPSEVGYSELTRAQDHLPESSGDCFQNGKGAEEVFRESSPGFDVLVDNAIMDADYLHEPDDFSNGFIPDERNLYLEEGYDPLHSGYESSSRLEMDGHNGPVDYQYYGKLQHRGDGDQHWTSSASERILDELEFSERRLSQRLRSPVEMDASDLRHRLTKQRRLNGSSSATRSDGHSYLNRYHAQNSYSDARRLPESTISNRLRGRIKLPKPSSREKRVKIFSVVPSGFQGRLGGRLGGRAAENSLSNARKLGRKEKAGDAANPPDFAGPRSLAELKGAKADGSSRSSISSLEPESMKSLKAAELPDCAVSVSFEGPKPLSVLLKRKRDAGPQNGAILFVSNNGKEENEVELHSSDAHKANFESYDRTGELDQPKVETGAEEEALNHADIDRITHGQHTAGGGTEAAAEGEEPQYSNLRDGGCEAEAGVDYKRKHDNTEHMDVDLDENEEEDDFAKKIGLIYS